MPKKPAKKIQRKRPSKPRPPADENAAAHQSLGELLGRSEERQAEREKNPAAVALGRLGGLKGGKARAEKLSAAQRSEIARKAAEKRWGSHSE